MGGGGVVSFMTNTVVVLMYVIFVIKFFFVYKLILKKAIFFTLGWSVMDAVKIKWWQKFYLFSHTLKFNIKSFRLLFFQFVLGNGWFCFEKQN